MDRAFPSDEPSRSDTPLDDGVDSTLPVSASTAVAAPRLEPTDERARTPLAYLLEALPAPPPVRRRVHLPHLGHRPSFGRVHLPTRVHTLDALRHRDYRLLWAATFFASGSYWLYQVVVGWLAFNLTGSPLLTAIAQGLDHLPFLVLGLLAGVIADTWDRRKIIGIVSAYQALVMLAFAIVTLVGDVAPWHLFVFALAAGVAWTLSDPARMALIPNMVPRHTLVNAIALNSLAFNAPRLVVPAAAGFLIASVGPGRTLMFGVALFLATTWTAVAIRMPRDEQTATKRRPSVRDLAETARYLKEAPSIRALLLLQSMAPLLMVPFVAGLMPVYAAEVFGVGSGGLGLLVSSMGIGAVAGSLGVASIGEIRNRALTLRLAVAFAVGGMAAFSLAPSMAMAVPALIVLSASTMTFFAVVGASIQSAVPDHLRGRVTSLAVMSFGLLPLGGLLAGGLAELLGAPTSTLIAAAAVAVLFTVFSVRFRRLI